MFSNFCIFVGMDLLNVEVDECTLQGGDRGCGSQACIIT